MKLDMEVEMEEDMASNKQIGEMTNIWTHPYKNYFETAFKKLFVNSICNNP